jgi:hypothetical protein
VQAGQAEYHLKLKITYLGTYLFNIRTNATSMSVTIAYVPAYLGVVQTPSL